MESYIEEAGAALNETFEPCIVLEDYKRENWSYLSMVYNGGVY